MSHGNEDGSQLAHVHVGHRGSLCQTTLTGELDMSNSDEIYRQLLAAGESSTEVTVDVSHLGFLDSAGINMLNRLRRLWEDRSVKLHIITGDDSIAGRTLALAGMDQVLSIRRGEAME
jgi:anti-anti-sigma factor